MARRTLVVGCSLFKDASIPTLPGASRDAADVFSALTSTQCGMAEPEPESVCLTDPTRHELNTSISDFLSRAGESDQFILYFAGHGAYLRGGGWTFYCRDTEMSRRSTTTFSYKDLQTLLNSRESARCILIFDACYSGSNADALKDAVSRGQVMDWTPRPNRKGLVLVTSSSAIEQAYEIGGVGCFTRLMIDGLKGGANTPSSEPYIYPAQLVSYVRARLKEDRLDAWVWPNCRESGDTADLFLALNPLHVRQAQPRSANAFHTPFPAETIATESDKLSRLRGVGERLIENIGCLEARRSRQPSSLSRYLRYDPVTETEVCLLPVNRSSVIEAEVWAWSFSLFLLVHYCPVKYFSYSDKLSCSNRIAGVRPKNDLS